jgi:hypothetical protein
MLGLPNNRQCATVGNNNMSANGMLDWDIKERYQKKNWESDKLIYFFPYEKD